MTSKLKLHLNQTERLLSEVDSHQRQGLCGVSGPNCNEPGVPPDDHLSVTGSLAATTCSCRLMLHNIRTRRPSLRRRSRFWSRFSPSWVQTAATGSWPVVLQVPSDEIRQPGLLHPTPPPNSELAPSCWTPIQVSGIFPMCCKWFRSIRHPDQDQTSTPAHPPQSASKCDTPSV